MKRSASLLLAALAVLCADGSLTAQSELCIDGSSATAFRKSVDRMSKSLESSERRVFDQAMPLIIELGPDPAPAAVRERLNGVSTALILDAGHEMIRELDTNGDGKIDDRELRDVRAKVAKTRKLSNEAAAVAILKNVSSAQAQTQAMGVIDVDGDGFGEYGYFGEMTGATPLRERDGRGKIRIDPPVLSTSFAVRGKRVERYGYVFQMWLPGDDGLAVSESNRGGVDAAQMPNPDLAEIGFTCYAWPIENGKTGERVFVIDQYGDIYISDNKLQKYSGSTKTPAPYAALKRGIQKLEGNLATKSQRNDRGRWMPDLPAQPIRGR